MSQKRVWQAISVDVQLPWQAVLVPLPTVPLEKSLRSSLRDTLATFFSRLRDNIQAASSTWLLLDTLHKDNAVQEIARHGREWLPEIGLGVWPDREPPSLWTQGELMNRDFQTPLRRLMHQVVHIASDEAAAINAWNTMFGTGGTIRLLLDKSTDEFHEEMREVFLPTIKEESFQAFPFYFPLLEKASIENKSSQMLEEWLGPAKLYMRESAEDSGVLIVSRIDLGEALDWANIEHNLLRDDAIS